jgi:hypothetical protein
MLSPPSVPVAEEALVPPDGAVVVVVVTGRVVVVAAVPPAPVCVVTGAPVDTPVLLEVDEAIDVDDVVEPLVEWCPAAPCLLDGLVPHAARARTTPRASSNRRTAGNYLASTET